MSTRGRVLVGLAGLWCLLLIPSVPLAQHKCFGFIGFLAHSPLYAFMALSAGFVALCAVLMRTESELVLKSRRVVPGLMVERGFSFQHPDWPRAARHLVAGWRGDA